MKFPDKKEALSRQRGNEEQHCHLGTTVLHVVHRRYILKTVLAWIIIMIKLLPPLEVEVRVFTTANQMSLGMIGAWLPPCPPGEKNLAAG